MAVQIVSSETINGDTFYRNAPFDISFSVASSVAVDVSLSFCNSTYGVKPYISSNHFTSPSGIPSTGILGILSVDALTATPAVVSTVTPNAYVSAAGICTDPLGNVYFAVANQNKVFKIDPSGTITTFAGTGAFGDNNGSRLTAEFRGPGGITTDGSGTFYVTDQYRVRKIDPAGTVTTLAGSSSRGTSDGTGSNARFYSASTPVIRPNGDLLVSDDDSHCIRSVTQAGVVTTYAGFPLTAGFRDGSLRPDSNITRIEGVSVMGKNDITTDGGTTWIPCALTNVLVQQPLVGVTTPTEVAYAGQSNSTYGGPIAFVSTANGTLRVPTSFPPNIVTLAYGLATDGSGTFVLGGLIAGGDAYLVSSGDAGSNWTSTSAVLSVCYTVAYAGGTWMAAGTPPYGSTSNLVTSSNSTAWTATAACPIADIRGLAYGGGRWVAIGADTPYTLAFSDDNGVTWSGRTPNVQAGIGVAYGNGVWIVAFDDYYSPLYRSTDGATFTQVISVSNGYYKGPYYSTQSGKWWVADGTRALTSTDGTSWSEVKTLDYLIRTFLDLSYTQTTYSSDSALFAFPHGLMYDPSGTLYIADQYNNRIRAISDGSGVVTTYAGSGAESISPGTLTTAGMARPSSLARDSSGTIYVGSFERNTLQSIVGSNVALVAGAEFSAGYVNGPAASSRFNGLAGLALVGNNVLYISEVYNGDVRRLVTLPEVSSNTDRPPGYTIIATSNYPITINSRIDVSWTSVGGSLPLYKYEPFCNTFKATGPSGTTLATTGSATELLSYLTGSGTSNVAFRGTNGANVAYPYTLPLLVQASSNSNVVDDISTAVTINAARIITTPCNSSLVFYRNEPSPAPVFSLVSSPAQLIYSASTLPAGLSFVKTASNAFTLTGTPTIQTATSNYTILGQDTSGRTYSTVVSMVVNPERLILDVSGSLSIVNASSNTPIPPITFTSRFPPYTDTGRAVTYSWYPAPPAGLQFARRDGIPVTGLSAPIAASSDASFALTLSGTITSQQIRDYASNGISSTALVFNGVRTNGGGLLSPAIPKTITFSFTETVLFDSSVSSLYVGRPVSSFYYSAKTYFPTDTSGTAITSIALVDGFIPDGLDASFTPATQRFSFAGTPSAAGSYAFTLQATNGRGTSASLPVTLVSSNDAVFITTTADACFNFIQYRPLTSPKAGSYPANIRYTATALSDSSVNLVGANLPAGVSLVPVSSGVYELQGVPTAASALTTATLTGTAQITGATATKPFLYSVSAEVFTFNDLSLAFSQNVPLSTPFPIVSATTLSEQPIIRYSSPSLPPALQIANTGKLTGTPEGASGGSFVVTAYTPYSSGTKPYTYSMTSDKVLLQPSVYTTITAPGGSISIPINGYSASATTVSNYRFSTASYGLGINGTTGLLSGTLASSLPLSATFTLVGSAGLVDGSLVGTLTTDKLTVNRAQMLENRGSGIRVVSSDDNGVTWPIAADKPNSYAYQIGTNGSNLFLIPTKGGQILRSSDGATYTSNVTIGTGGETWLTGITNKPGTSTWWIGGTLLSGSTRSVYVFKSTDDGLTWDTGTNVTTNGFTDRTGNATSYLFTNAYLNGGVELAYKDGVLLLGGNQILRSMDEGTTWVDVSSGLIEVSSLCVDHETVWIAAGTSYYSTSSPRNKSPNITAKTLKYSSDLGLTWTDVISGFGMIAYQVRYGNGIWLASGFDRTGITATCQIRASVDGLTWTPLTSLPSYTYTFGTTTALPIGPIGLYPIALDGTDWNVLSNSGTSTAVLYTHTDDKPLNSGWTSLDITAQFPTIGNDTRFFSYVAQTLDPGADVTTLTFPLPNTGPVFTSPAQTTFVLWQYMPVPTISFVAPGATAYFVSELPVGLTWDPVAHTITGACVRTGTQTFTVYAQNSGLTALVITLFVEVPRIVKQQSGAGAYTSLLRQYTEVNAAQKARDSHAYPTQVSGIGEFASPYPPDVITPSNCPC